MSNDWMRVSQLSCYLMLLVPLGCGPSNVPRDQRMGADIRTQLDWPIPKPTYGVPLGRKLVAGPSGTFEEAAQNLGRWLSDTPAATQPGWFYLPFEGFAVLGPIEPIDENGKATSDPFKLPPPIFSKEYVRRLLSGVRAHYRVMLFIVAGESFDLDKNAVSDWIEHAARQTGYWSLPERLRDHVYDEKYSCRLLIYEFSRLTKDGQPQILQANNGALELNTHLAAWHIERLVGEK